MVIIVTRSYMVKYFQYLVLDIRISTSSDSAVFSILYIYTVYMVKHFVANMDSRKFGDRTTSVNLSSLAI